MFNFIAKKIFGSVNDRLIKKFELEVVKINSFEPAISALSDDELRNKTLEFKNRLVKGETLDALMCEAFAVVREASKRVLKMRHFDTQLIGGMALHQGNISEMKTGEGKTLVATLPCYLNALSGKNVCVVTTNDYLAKRDSAWMGKVHEFLGLSVGCITNELNDDERREQYKCDITYATNNELGFDYLRDNMKYLAQEKCQRDHFFAIVDEVDSILIDEARTPLVISGPTNDNSKLYEEINNLIPKLSQDCYQIEEKERAVFLNDKGVEEMEKILKKQGSIAKDASLFDINYVSYVHHINQALKAHKIFRKEVDYVVKNNSVVIIDEFTGRMQEGRRFSDGLHQALEAKEGVRIRNENQTLASITFQNYFRLYDKLAGMTGTASTEAVEFEEIYGLKVIEIPTNKPISRKDEDDEIYKTESAKNDAIVKSVKEAHEKQQPVLLGTVSIEKSEELSKLLHKHKLPHSVLNAKYHEQEAQIIAQAGRPGAITIATNMAGRGTDIVLGGNPEFVENDDVDDDAGRGGSRPARTEGDVELDYNQAKQTVINAGGLYVLGSERHESRRIDNQLRGRSGRQGDPGKSKFFLSLEDDLMRIFGSDKLQAMLSRLGLKDDEAIFHPWITRTLAKAQQKVENRNYEIRKNLLKYDDIVNQQRKNIFALRNKVMKQESISEKIQKMIEEINEDIVGKNIPKNSYIEQWDIEAMETEIKRIYGVSLDIKNEAKKDIAEREILDFINKNIDNLFSVKKSLYGQKVVEQVEKQIFLITLDGEWKDHLLSLDKLRHGINLRAYAQKDPLIEYKKDAFELFEDMMMRLEENVVSRLAHMQIRVDSENSDGEINLLANEPKQQMFVGRSDPAMNGVGQEGAFEKEGRGVASSQKQRQNVPLRTNLEAGQRNPQDPNSWGNVGRNEFCPCGSGKKYKQCHGKV